jgi:hypothetical protein
MEVGVVVALRLVGGGRGAVVKIWPLLLCLISVQGYSEKHTNSDIS